jgi:protein associated with RNAse G/E
MAGGLVQVIYRKYDGTLHWNYWTRRLGEDRYGLWVGAPGGTALRKGAEVVNPAEWPHVLLLPRDEWWTGSFNAAPHRTEIYCDVTTVPSWPEPDQVTMIDLDLDVRRRRTGTVEILDEDEFAEHRIRYGYPEEVVAAAQASAECLAAAIRANDEPFASVYRGWLAQLVEAPVPDGV